ncbi:VCBS repeat-containing protein [Flavisolibacter ginsenosidimutans]|nr:VCBS repeat-containing protein [Flavisolibacter ginsenosidimutans]
MRFVKEGNWIFFLLASTVMLSSCKSNNDDKPSLFTLQKNTGISFRNDVKDSKDDNSFLFRNFYNGGGVATGDINNDGLPDVFFTSNQGENKLYLNKGAFQFEDISVKAGLKQDGLWNTGVTFVDVNADGWLDIYVCSSGHMKDGHRKNKLYINQHNNTFTEEGAKYGLDVSGYCTQAVFFDYDNDGDLDCFIINNSPIPFSSLNYADMRDVDISKWQIAENLKGGGNHLYRNDGPSRPSRWEGHQPHNTSIVGESDNRVASSKSRPSQLGEAPPPEGFGEAVHFTEVTAQAGLHTGLISFGLGVTVGDVNDDGYPDIYVGNDFIEKDYLYINQKNGTFKDELESCVQKISMSSMSADLGDINNDGSPDIFTTDMIPDDDYRLKTTGTFDNIDLYLSKQKAGLYHQYVRNCLQVNNGNNTFSEIANYAGVYGTDWSWGAVFLDADNDGLNDIFVCNGIAKDLGNLDFLDFFSNDVYTKMVSTGQRMEMDELLKHIPVTPLPNRVFRNKGNLGFEDAGKAWGFAQPSFSNSVAYADLDGDGDLDLIVNNENQEAFVYRNNESERGGNHFLALQLKGKSANPFAIGATIKAYKGGQIFYREVSPVRGFQSSMDYKQIIGLGKESSVDSVVVLWPDKTKSVYTNLQTDKTHVLQESNDNEKSFLPSPNAVTLFELLPQLFDKHKEDDYVDFYYERNLPEMLSREGPHIARGDVNGDGLEDVYIGGAKDQPGQLYLQTIDGKFIKKEEPIFNEYKDFEDVAVLFFDADGDGDLDLFIGAGGNNVPRGTRAIEHRLYINDGKGNFTINTKAFPANEANISVATAYDYDGDGDLDLFVGGRSVPFSYGVAPRSYLYQNDGHGNFSDVTTSIAPELLNIGMITSATWANVNGDNKKELIVAGEWMAPKIFSFRNGKFVELKNTGLENLYGWWQSLSVADLKNDGHDDLILGNIGENFYLRPTEKTPVKLWVKDFDGNGTPDQFLTQTINGKDMPVFLKRDITEQFPFLKKDNLKNSDYATKTIQDLFGEKALKDASVLTFNYCASVVAINKGNSSFDVQPLPVRAQLSSVDAVCSIDVNNDGKIDLITGGNLFTFPPQFGRLDASYGDVFVNNGKGGFTWVPNMKSGIDLRGEVKDIKAIEGKKGKCLLITQNNETPLLYRLK